LTPSGRRALVVVGASAFGLVLWWWAARRAGPLLLPEPPAVVSALWRERARLGAALLETGTSALGALVLATAAGLGAAVAGWWSRALAAALVPYTVLVQVVPIVAIAPMLVVWLGYGSAVALCTGAIAAFFPVYSSAITGLASPAQDWVDLFRLHGATRGQELLRLRLPAALPALFSGLRSAGGLAVIGAIVGEFVGSNGSPPTIGQLVVYAAGSANMDLCFAAVTVAALLALSVRLLLGWLERRTIGHWFGR
jgi:NitT/TauT family transport system permease protein